MKTENLLLAMYFKYFAAILILHLEVDKIKAIQLLLKGGFSLSEAYYIINRYEATNIQTD